MHWMRCKHKENGSIHNCRRFPCLAFYCTLSLEGMTSSPKRIATRGKEYYPNAGACMYLLSVEIGGRTREESRVCRLSHSNKQSRWQRVLAYRVFLNVFGRRRPDGFVILGPRDRDGLISLYITKQVYFVSNDSLHDFKILRKMNWRIDVDFGRSGHWTSNTITPVKTDRHVHTEGKSVSNTFSLHLLRHSSIQVIFISQLIFCFPREDEKGDKYFRGFFGDSSSRLVTEYRFCWRKKIPSKEVFKSIMLMSTHASQT
jgi:hypothetical protein